MEPKFFTDGEAFRAWLEEHHATETELRVGFYKRGSGNTGITWSEAVDEALCYGWIDSVMSRIDDASYALRFTPRKPNSTWSAVNLAKVSRLIEAGRMREAGRRAYEQRTEGRSRTYAHEQAGIAFPREMLVRFHAHPDAWTFFDTQAPWYQRAATWWVISAKREETQQRRLATLIEDSAHGRRIRSLDRNAASTATHNTG